VEQITIEKAERNGQKYSKPEIGENNNLFPDSNFWDDFVLNYWNKKTLCKKSEFISFPLDADELFALCIANSSPDSEKFNDTVTLYVDNKKVNRAKCIKDNLYPQKSDINFRNYEKRLLGLFGEQEYVFKIDAMIVNTKLRKWSYLFLKSLYNSAPDICQGHTYGLFFGNYKSTPYGVHVDSEGYDTETGFYFTVEGKKEFYAWSPEYVEKNPAIKGTKKYGQYIAGSNILESNKNGMFYWPGDYWHIAHSPKADISVTLCVRAGSDYAELLFNMTRDEIHSHYHSNLARYFNLLKLYMRKIPFSLGFRDKDDKEYITKARLESRCFQINGQKIPDTLHRAGKYLESMLSLEVVEKAKIKVWLEVLSTYGFEALYNFEESQLDLKKDIQLIENHQIIWKRYDDSTILIALNGHANELKCNKNKESHFILLLAEIHTGEVFSFIDFLKKNPELDTKANLAWIVKFIGMLFYFKIVKYTV
jgi:hypothetical protein